MVGLAHPAAELIRPNQASILYLGGYDHLTQSTIVAIVLKSLFEQRAGMTGAIPPFLAVVEEAHNFIHGPPVGWCPFNSEYDCSLIVPSR